MLTGLFGLAATATGVAGRPDEALAAKSHGRLDAVIDISHSTTVNDFRLARRRSNILGVIHKASEGGDLLKERTSDLKQTAAEWVDKGKEALNRQKGNLADAVEAGKQAYRDARGPATPSEGNA